jgi:hypothetical protein
MEDLEAGTSMMAIYLSSLGAVPDYVASFDAVATRKAVAMPEVHVYNVQANVVFPMRIKEVEAPMLTGYFEHALSLSARFVPGFARKEGPKLIKHIKKLMYEACETGRSWGDDDTEEEEEEQLSSLAALPAPAATSSSKK